jgi:sugar phosphate isomerase/epimerase
MSVRVPVESRRSFLAAAGAAVAVAALPRWVAAADEVVPFKISLAQWSLHKKLFAKEIDHLDFAKIAREKFGIEAVEYVTAFFKGKARDASYLAEMNKRCGDHGVRSLLIMVDGEGELGNPDAAARTQAIENHKQWLEAAKALGCHSIRVNAASGGSYAEQLALAADGLARLGELGEQYGLNVIVENHGGLSSNGAWLAGVMRRVGRPNVGTLPDFGNFCISGRGTPEAVWYDRYQGMEDLMPFAKAVSAKSYEFNAAGDEVQTDFPRVMRTVLNHGYSGYVGIEWEGENPDEYEGVRLTKALLEKIRDEVA